MTDTHDVLLKDNSRDYVEMLAEVQTHVNGLPETKATFKPSDEFEMWAFPIGIWDALISFTGSWEVPNRYSTGNVRKYVNPNNPHAHRYSDASAECPNCGGIITYMSTGESDIKDNSDRHDESCTVYHKYETLAQIARRREEIMRRCYYYGSHGKHMRARVGARNNSISSYARDLDIDSAELRGAYRTRRQNTVVELLHDGYSVREIADAYDVSTWTIRNDVEERTGKPTSEVKA